MYLENLLEVPASSWSAFKNFTFIPGFWDEPYLLASHNAFQTIPSIAMWEVRNIDTCGYRVFKDEKFRKVYLRSHVPYHQGGTQITRIPSSPSDVQRWTTNIPTVIDLTRQLRLLVFTGFQGFSPPALPVNMRRWNLHHSSILSPPHRIILKPQCTWWPPLRTLITF